MADYYKTSYSSAGGGRRRKRSAAGYVVDVFAGVVTFVVVALFITTLFVPTLDPREWNEVSTLGLVAPFIYVAQVALTLYWIVRWRMFFAVPMIFISLLGVFQLSHHQLPEFTQIHVHRVGDAIQPSHPLSSPSPPAPNPSQHQGLFE